MYKNKLNVHINNKLYMISDINNHFPFKKFESHQFFKYLKYFEKCDPLHNLYIKIFIYLNFRKYILFFSSWKKKAPCIFLDEK